VYHTPKIRATETPIILPTCVPSPTNLQSPISHLVRILAEALPQKEIYLSKFTSAKTDFHTWANEVLKTLSAAKKYCPFITRTNNLLILDDTLPDSLRLDLSLALGKALDQQAKDISGISSSLCADGYDKWLRLHKTLGKLMQSSLEKQELLQKLQNSVRQLKQSLHAFKVKYNILLRKFRLHGLTPVPTTATEREICYLNYLRLLNHSALDNVRLEINTNTANGVQWMSIATLEALQDTAADYIDSYNLVKSIPIPTPKPNPNRETTPPRTTNKTPITQRASSFELKVKDKPEVKVIKQLQIHAKMHPGCHIHHMYNHLFKDCSIVRKMLTHYQCFPCLAKTFTAPPSLAINTRARCMLAPADAEILQTETENLYR